MCVVTLVVGQPVTTLSVSAKNTPRRSCCLIRAMTSAISLDLHVRRPAIATQPSLHLSPSTPSHYLQWFNFLPSTSPGIAKRAKNTDRRQPPGSQPQAKADIPRLVHAEDHTSTRDYIPMLLPPRGGSNFNV